MAKRLDLKDLNIYYGAFHAEPIDPRSGMPEPVVMVFNYFNGRLEAFTVEMGNSSSELVDYFIKKTA